METSTDNESDAARIDERELLHKGFVSLERMTVTHPARDGASMTVVREIHDHGSGIAVLPVDEDRRTVLLVRQFRVPVFLDDGDGHLVEACAGLIEDGEDVEATVVREAAEELGYRVRDLEKVGSVYSSPGIVTERMTTYLAGYRPGDRLHDGGGLAHEGEDIEVLEWSCDALRDAVLTGKIRDSKLLVLAQALMLQRPELFSLGAGSVDRT